MLVLVACIENFGVFLENIDPTDLYGALHFIRDTSCGMYLLF